MSTSSSFIFAKECFLLIAADSDTYNSGIKRMHFSCCKALQALSSKVKKRIWL
jgi:hypothetical protein